jgi:hypothetical protein
MALDFELLRKEFQEVMAQRSLEEYWVPEFGDNLVRILPPRDGKLFYKKVGVHYRLAGSGMEFCPRIVGEGECPICEVVDGLRKMKTPAAVQLVNRLVVVEKFLMNVIPLREGEQKQIRQYLSPKSVWLAILKIILDPDYGDITDLVKGRNVVIEKVQASGNFVNYSVRAKPTIISVKEILGRELKIEEIPDLNEIVLRRLKSYDALKIVLYGGDEELGIDELVEKYSERKESDVVERRYVEEGNGESTVVGRIKGESGHVSLEEMMKVARSIVEQLKQQK